MGLDQFAYKIKNKPEKPVDFEIEPYRGGEVEVREVGNGLQEHILPEDYFEPAEDVEEIAYWRKHPDLHGFIREIYRAKGGTEFQWNEFTGPVVLDMEDIDAIERATMDEALPKTTGFFFGESNAGDKRPTLEFCARAREAIHEGWTVAYTSSW